MKSVKSLMILGTMLVAGSAFAQVSATDSASATATIVPGITLSNTVDLAFGDMLSPAAAGTATVDTADGITYGGVVGAGGTVTSALFDVTGGANKGYDVTLPSAAITISSGANTMTVDTFTSSCASCTLDGTGTGSFTVGGTLNVGAAQAEGSYAGTFDVTVAYN